MADRYWVAGSGSWNSTTKWSTTSGGASGASVPTAADNAIFDVNSSSGVYTVTVTDNATCANLTFTPEPVDGVTVFDVGVNFVIAGTFSTSGTQGNRRVWFRSSAYGLMRNMQIATIGTVTDVDFRDIRVTGAGGTLAGTRIGNLGGCLNITFNTPKTVYWNLAGAQNWSANGWSDTSTGTPSTDFFPLAQDTATFTNAGSVTGTITMNAAVPYTGTVDMSGRSSAMILNISATQEIYGDWKNGSGTTLVGSAQLGFQGRSTQTITSSGKTFSCPIAVLCYGGAVELADPLSTGTQNIFVTEGTFNTKNHNVTAGSLSSNNINVRAIKLGSSTLTLSGTTPIAFATSTNLTLDAGTSTINLTAASSATFQGGVKPDGSGNTFYDVSFNVGPTAQANAVFGVSTFRNLSFTAPAVAGVTRISIAGNQTITGTLTVAGASPVRRIFASSNTLGTQSTLNVGTLSATDCDFRDIAITGTAAGASPTRAGDCGGNSGITFPAAKTVYWNLAGAQNWSATAWAPGTGGVPDINNFPLAQDTAVFDEAAGSVTGTITIDSSWNIGTFDASARTSAMTLTTGSNTPFVYGDWKFGTGVTSSSTGGTITFAKRGTQTITSNGVQFGCPLTVNCVTGVAQLADALSLGATRTLTLTSGTFDVVTYNVTAGLVSISGITPRTLKMGSGTWTLTGTGTIWTAPVTTNLAFYKGTANIVLSDTSTAARTFSGSLSYNKLTIGGTTGSSTLTISGNNQFTELASTKTVPHTIALGSTTQTFGKWTVTGTAGNVVTLTGTGTSHILAGACTSGIDYLAMGSIGFDATSPGEFYAGANSTGTAGAPVYRTAKPADSTRYWVGGNGNWSLNLNWSNTSGGTTTVPVPRSHDDVIFDTNSSGGVSYTVTVNAVTGGIRMKSLTIAGPATGTVTLAGSAAMDGIHGNVTLPATGLTRTYTGNMVLSSNSTGRTFTTNGVALASFITVNGVDCGWTLGSNLTATNGGVFVTNGTFNTSTYNITTGQISSDNANSRTITFGAGTMTLTDVTFVNFGTTETNRAGLVFNTGTAQIDASFGNPTLAGNNQTFYNVSFTNTSSGTITIKGDNSFNNLTFAGPTSQNIKTIVFENNQIITGTLTCSAGTDATARRFIRSNTLGTTRTITAAAVSMTDVDFRDITIAGAAAPASGTRIGDCKGNSGITFTAAANKYWNLAAGGNWSGAIGWATSSGGTPAINNFPLAQDTCFFEATGLNSGATVTINDNFNIGTIDMSARTTNTMTLATGSTTPAIYGNWINGTGTTLTGTGTMTFAGRGSQTLTSAGNTFTQAITVDTPGGSVTLQDAFVSSNANGSALRFDAGTFDANTYNVTLSGSTSGINGIATTTAKTIAIGSGTWTVGGTNGWTANTSATVTGTGTISLTSASAKTFAGGGIAYTNITLNQGGAGTLTISGNNTFKDITNTYKATGATNITMGTTTQSVSQWTAAGEAGRLLTIQGTSAVIPCALIHTGTGTAANVNYLVITGVRAY